ncbi:MAG: rod shape-determining protein, partial [Bacteroidales bacterium]|nr:rod shape-determining protein [Bacteroidales bacterium]
LVDIGGGTTDIAIFYDGIIRHTSVIPLAGQAITSDIRRGCSILPDQAESLKVKYGSCLPANEREGDAVSIPGIRNQPPKEIGLKVLANIIKARVQIIMEQVAYEINTAGYSGKNLSAGLVLTGGGASLKYIKEFASLITGMDTRTGLPSEHLVAESDAELAHPKYATGIGLVLYGIEHEEARLASRRAKEKTAEPEPTNQDEQPVAPEPKDQSIIDILNNMPGTKEKQVENTATVQEPEPIKVEPVSSPTPKPKEDPEKPDDSKGTKKPSLMGKITEFMWKIVGDDDIK